MLMVVQERKQLTERGSKSCEETEHSNIKRESAHLFREINVFHSQTVATLVL